MKFLAPQSAKSDFNQYTTFHCSFQDNLRAIAHLCATQVETLLTCTARSFIFQIFLQIPDHHWHVPASHQKNSFLSLVAAVTRINTPYGGKPPGSSRESPKYLPYSPKKSTQNPGKIHSGRFLPRPTVGFRQVETTGFDPAAASVFLSTH